MELASETRYPSSIRKVRCLNKWSRTPRKGNIGNKVKGDLFTEKRRCSGIIDGNNAGENDPENEPIQFGSNRNLPNPVLVSKGNKDYQGLTISYRTNKFVKIGKTKVLYTSNAELVKAVKQRENKFWFLFFSAKHIKSESQEHFK